MTEWSFEDVPNQTGRLAIVTGSNSGIGFEAARMLALRGAHVVLACRNMEKGRAALERISRERADAKLQLCLLDLSDLRSVSRFAEQFRAGSQRLDLLINNAGVMNTPLSRTAQGFELQFGTNHLSHFALVAQLWPLLARTTGARVVVISSATAHSGRIDFDDPNFERRRYQGWVAYAQSKLANSLFALELARRAAQASSSVIVCAAHPGWTATDLPRGTPFIRFVNPLLAMPAAKGALTTLRAAVDPRAANGSYWGPGRAFELIGPPKPARIPRRARDPLTAQRLWALSEQLTGVRFELS
ncbi:MAG TPA: oxidoreductase [Polyangiales bacterium]|jgi:NAD(P)-dependent dehydrogenase (short-subunit alcohol dehydrogenase family)|nr:oxidoreductase [Polyangiales bacterium]